jgi:hypothetical protein
VRGQRDGTDTLDHYDTTWVESEARYESP